jgi:hypothetical protein
LFSIQIHTTWAYRAGGSPPLPHGESAVGGATAVDGGPDGGAATAAGDALPRAVPGGALLGGALLGGALLGGALLGVTAGPVAVLEGDTDPEAACW